MSYRVLVHPKAAEFLKRTDESLKDRTKTRLRELEDSPEKKSQRLKHTPCWKIRIGDYRAIYTIEEEPRRVIVPFIGHRREVYDDFSKLL